MTDQEKIIKANSLIRRFRDLVISEFSNDGESEDDVKVGHYQKLVNEAKGFLEADGDLQVPNIADKIEKFKTDRIFWQHIGRQIDLLR